LKIADEIPQLRDFHSATNIDDRMYIFGGRFDQMGAQQIPENFYDNRLYVFDPQDKSWSLITVGGQIPCGRRSHSACMF
jgi:N-acetylneuraminic acid mutarotase